MVLNESTKRATPISIHFKRVQFDWLAGLGRYFIKFSNYSRMYNYAPDFSFSM